MRSGIMLLYMSGTGTCVKLAPAVCDITQSSIMLEIT